MEDIGDILFYVIAGIIAIASGIANNKKKKAQKAAAEQQAASQDEDFEFPDIETEPETMQAEKMVAETQYEMISQDGLETYDTGFGDEFNQKAEKEDLIMDAKLEGQYSEPLADDFFSEGAPVTELQISETELGTKSEIPLEAEQSKARSLADEFDLAKAIVYSEILQRKDFV